MSRNVIGGCGVVSLMGYETCSYALYDAYEGAYGTSGAAPVALMMTALAGLFILAELILLRRVVLTRAGSDRSYGGGPVRLGWLRAPALAFLAGVLMVALIVPVMTIVYWASRVDLASHWRPLGGAIRDSLSVSLPAAFVAVLAATPIAYMARRYPSRMSLTLARLSFLGYATPSPAVAPGPLVVLAHLPPGSVPHAAGILVAH